MSEFIRRSTFKEGFAIIPQAVFRTEGMSFEAIGLQAYLLSLPDKWVIRDTQLRKKGGKNGRPLGLRVFKRIVKELENGWLAAPYPTACQRREWQVRLAAKTLRSLRPSQEAKAI
jgi:hypothetical protein